ncbi:beta-ketoacyl synthase N-terminal-like domain-containing protein [Streptococcus dentasini]
MRKYAIIGIAGRFPDANTPAQFFDNLLMGKSSFRKLSSTEVEESPYSQDEHFIPVTSTIDNVYGLDIDLFKMTAAEARLTDPQQRIFLKCCYEALEDASHVNSKDRIGVFASSAQSSYLISNIFRNKGLDIRFDYSTYIGNETDFNATRVSYKLNLTGPSMSVQSGCSSALVALNEACRNIDLNTCDLALVGGVSITFPLASGYSYKEGTTFSRSGQLRAFDKDADGMIKGDGCGVVVIKPYDRALSDNDNIYAVISGIGINNDGNNKVGYTAPSVRGEYAAIKDALISSGINPEHIDYIETHGTGTKIGDPIEVRALSKAYNFQTPHRIGSVKSNIGHLDTASGIIGLIKGALILKNNIIPKSIGFTSENPQANLESSRLFVDTQENIKLPQNRKNYVGVSSFGIGGTNVHVILESCLSTENSKKEELENYVLQISAKSKVSLDSYRNKLAVFLENHSELKLIDITRTLNEGRKSFENKYNFEAANIPELVRKLYNNETTDRNLSIVQGGNFVSLPTYSFNEQNYSLTPNESLLKKTISITKPKNEDVVESDVISEICNIWGDELGEEVLETSDFFELNGDSLIAVGLIDRINKKFKIKLGTDVLLNYATPKKLTDYILNDFQLSGKSSIDLSNIYCLNKGKEGSKNLFLVHPAGGSVFCFRELFSRIELDYLNIYAIAFPKDINSELTLTELSKIYIQQIRKIQPEGRYFLGGYSFGGNVAVEMARLLEKEDLSVEKIYMIDSLVPDAYPREQPLKESYLHIFPLVLDFMSTNNKYGLNYIKDYSNIEVIVNSMKDNGDLSESLDINYIKRVFDIWKSNYIALLNQSKERVNSDIIVFSAKENMPNIVYTDMNIKRCDAEEWQNYTSGNVCVIQVSGNHYTSMSDDSNLNSLAATFENHLQRLQ